MSPKDVIRNTLDTSDFFIKSYMSDLTDDEIKLVPVEGMNPIAMQMGHLIAVEHMINELVEPGSAPALPAGFAEAHDMKKPEGASGFRSKDEYVKLWDEQRAATKAVLDRLNDADLADNRGGKLPPWAPTVGVALNMAGMHALNHSGQFVAVRRKLNKPITV